MEKQDLEDAVRDFIKKNFCGKVAYKVVIKPGSEVKAEIGEPSNIDPY